METARARITIDDAPFNAFHARLTAFTTGGYFCDGYILGIIGAALVLGGPKLHLDAAWTGLIGASSLIGLFLGSLVLGPVIDRFGRQLVYTADLAFFVVASVLQFFVTNPAELFVLRLLMGIGIGADYDLGSTLLGEFSPRRFRGVLLSSLNAVWTVGYVVAFLVGYWLQGLGPDSWRWMLASSAVPAFLVLLLRIGTPESPRWLISKGRVDEARAILRRHVHPDAEIEDLLVDAYRKADFGRLLARPWRTRTLFGGLFWFCQVVPYFAIFTFQAEVLKAAHLQDPLIGGLVLDLFLLLGALAGLWCVHRFGRRPFVIWTFALCIPFLGVLGVWPAAPPAVALACFAVFAFVVSLAADLESTYPSELFPTEIRATGVGVCTAISRIGAAIGTFLLPIGIERFGIGGSMLAGTAILIVGLVISILWAPETRGLSLAEASGTAPEEARIGREAI